MEMEIIKLIANAGAFAIVIAILFYYSVYSFKSSKSEKVQLRSDLTQLQKEFHEFKNQMIEKLISITAESKKSIDDLTDSIERNFKCKT